MNENEQIQEMARVLYVAREHLCIGAECEFYMVPHTEEFDCRELWNAKKLYSAGYRKVERGKWKLGKSGCMYFCPKCNYAAHQREAEEWDFCPRCGADMRGDNNAEIH